jgi:hypothetical protein
MRQVQFQERARSRVRSHVHVPTTGSVAERHAMYLPGRIRCGGMGQTAKGVASGSKSRIGSCSAL